MAITLISGRIIASRDGIRYIDGFFLSVSAITAGGLVPLDMSRLSSGSHGLLFTLFTCAGVTFTALPPLLWRVWLYRVRFRPLIAEAQALTVSAAKGRAEEAALAQRLAAALAAAEAAAAKRTAAAVAKAAAAWTAPSAAAAAAAAAEVDAELTLAPGDFVAAAADGSVLVPTVPAAGTPSPPSTPPLPRGASFQVESSTQELSLPPLHRPMSFSMALFGGGGGFFGSTQQQPEPATPSAAARAAAAELAANEAARAAAAAAAFSEEDAEDYAALSQEFEAQNEALITVAVAVALYVLFWHVFGAIAFASCYAAEGPHLPSLVARNISPTWLSIFLLSSALNNTGLSLLDDSLISIALRPKSLMVLAAAIVAGNTGWPVALRLALHAWSVIGSALGGEASGGWRRCRGARYALQHPERCYHLLYDARGTLAIATAVLVTTVFQLIFFYATSSDKVTGDLNDLADAQGVPRPSRAAVRTIIFFQVISVRSAGFQVLDLKRIADVVNVIMAFMFWFAPQPFVAALREAEVSARLGLADKLSVMEDEEGPEPPALLAAPPTQQLSQLSRNISIAPYSVAATPAALSARTLRLRSNARAAGTAVAAADKKVTRGSQSSGALADDEVAAQLHGRNATAAAAAAAAAEEAEVRGKHTLRGVIMRRYIARHASWLFFGYITVAASDHALLEAPPRTPYGRSPTSLFNYLFELLSAYGTNGLSTGYPGVNFNLVGMWKPVSKMVVIGVLFLGRHRNLPRAVDRPLAAHVRALAAIVDGLRTADRAQRRALDTARVAAEAAEAAAAAEEEPCEEARPARSAAVAATAQEHVSLEEALKLVRAHVHLAEVKAAGTEAAPAEADGSVAVIISE
jgi:Trk-type K+ transport system membrane component